MQHNRWDMSSAIKSAGQVEPVAQLELILACQASSGQRTRLTDLLKLPNLSPGLFPLSVPPVLFPPQCENFLYGFKGAQSAPGGLAHRTCKAPRTESTVPSAAHRLSVISWAPCGPWHALGRRACRS